MPRKFLLCIGTTGARRLNVVHPRSCPNLGNHFGGAGAHAGAVNVFVRAMMKMSAWEQGAVAGSGATSYGKNCAY